jgi:hypothetical protein
MRTKSWAVVGCGLAVVSAVVGIAIAQEPYPRDPFGGAQAQVEAARTQVGNAKEQVEYAQAQVAKVQSALPSQFVEVSTEPDVKVKIRTSMPQAIAGAAKQFRDAPDDEHREAARKKLAEYLDKYFEDDMQGRKAEIEKVEKRVEKLRSLLDKRASKKQEIIDLQLKVVENDAEGLGFFSSGAPMGSGPMVFGRGMGMGPGGEAGGMGGGVAWSIEGLPAGGESQLPAVAPQPKRVPPVKAPKKAPPAPPVPVVKEAKPGAPIPTEEPKIDSDLDLKPNE